MLGYLLHVKGTNPREIVEEVLDIRIKPSSSYTEENPIYSIEFGIWQSNGNWSVKKIIDQVYYDGSDNLFALLWSALEVIKDNDGFKHDNWTFTTSKEIE